jgi:hypothetical protein
MNRPRASRPRPQPKAALKSAKIPATTPKATVPAQADQAAAFFREVDEAMRVEKLQNFWQRWRWALVSGVLGAITAAAAWQGYGAWQAHRNQTTATRWDELSRLTTTAELAKELPTFVANNQAGYQALGQLAQAAAAPTAAAKLAAYQALANAPAQPAWLRAFGQLNAALVLLEINPAEAQAQLELLAQTEVGTPPLPTVPLALELLALQAMQKGDKATAKAYTTRLLELPQQGGSLTPALRSRALQRLGALQ